MAFRFLCALALVSVVPQVSSAVGSDGTRHVLTIGNSFSVDLGKYLPKVAKDQGVKLDLMNLYIGGCSLERHWNNVLSNDVDTAFKPYYFMRNGLGKFKDGHVNVCDALRAADWDFVTLQQASHLSWKPETYHPWGDNLVRKVRELAPRAKIVLQETWSYTPWDKRLRAWKVDQNEMYAKLHDAYAGFARPYGLAVIPFGTAVQEWRRRLPVKYTENSFGGDVVGGRVDKTKATAAEPFRLGADGKWVPTCDVFHLNDRGNYFQALVWAGSLLDIDARAVAFRPEGVTESDAALMRTIAAELTARR